MLSALLRLARPRQWTKNALVFAAILFAPFGQSAQAWINVGLAFLAMVLLSAAVYAINDVRDAEADRLHPRKKNRPVASGRISPALALSAAGLYVVLGLGIAVAIGTQALVVCALYLALQLAYVYSLKHIAVIDVFAISLGFVLRAQLGAVAVPVAVSGWLIFCTGALALMIATAKRRQEFRAEHHQESATRPALRSYSEKALDALVLFSAGLAAIAYGIYAIDSPAAARNPNLLATALPVLFGISRYLVIVFGSDEGEEPEEVLLTDPGIWLALVGFLITAIWALGFSPARPLLGP